MTVMIDISRGDLGPSCTGWAATVGDLICGTNLQETVILKNKGK